MVAEWNLSTCPEGYFKIGTGLDLRKKSGKTIYYPSRNAVAPRTMRSIREEGNGLLRPFMNAKPEVRDITIKLEPNIIPRPHKHKAGNHGTCKKPQVDIMEVIPELNSSEIEKAACEAIADSWISPPLEEDTIVVKKIFLDKGTSMDSAELPDISKSPKTIVLEEKKAPVYADVAVQSNFPKHRSVRCQTQRVSEATAMEPEETEAPPPILKISTEEIALIKQLYKKKLKHPKQDTVLKKNETRPFLMVWVRRIFPFVILLILIFIIWLPFGMKYLQHSAAKVTTEVPINPSSQSVGALFKQSLSDCWKILTNLTHNLLLRCNWIVLACMSRPN